MAHFSLFGTGPLPSTPQPSSSSSSLPLTSPPSTSPSSLSLSSSQAPEPSCPSQTSLPPSTYTPPPRPLPSLNSLPQELLAMITSDLSLSTLASLSLTSRFLLSSLGLQHLHAYTRPKAPHGRFRARTRMELLERAFPRDGEVVWYCAWCDRFHVIKCSSQAEELTRGSGNGNGNGRKELEEVNAVRDGPIEAEKETQTQSQPQPDTTPSTQLGPRTFNLLERASSPNCTEHNSYLHGGGADSLAIVVCYHHVRLALNRHRWGPSHGIPLSSFTYSGSWKEKKADGKKWKNEKEEQEAIDVVLSTEARIADGRLVLRGVCWVAVPWEKAGAKRRDGGGGARWCWGEVLLEGAQAREDRLVDRVMACLPQIVAGHRFDGGGHTGLRLAVKDALVRIRGSGEVSRIRKTDTCALCATEYEVQVVRAEEDVEMSGIVGEGDCRAYRDDTDMSLDADASTPVVFLKVTSWRDLGDGRSPFDASWRAHGEIGKSEPGFGGDVLRLTGLRKGDIRGMFERGHGGSSEATDRR